MGELDGGFYDVSGFKVTKDFLMQQMINYYNNKYPDAQITDFNEGSQIRNLLETFSTDIYHLEFQENSLLRQAFLTTATGYYLDLFGEEYGIKRNNALQAQGVVTFSISSAVNYPINIPANTRITNTETGLFYDTWTSVEIPVGATSVTCPVRSMITGSKTNIPANSEFVFYNENLLNEVSISNSEAFTEGRDAESDEDYRERLLEEKTSDGFGSKSYYVKLGKIGCVHDIALVDSLTHTAKVIVNGYSDSTISDDLLALVTAQYTNEKNLIYNQTFEVVKAEFTTIPLEISIDVSSELQEETLKTIIKNYFTGANTNINNQQFVFKGCSVNSIVSRTELMNMIEGIDGVIQITDITSDSEEFTKLEPVTNKVLRVGTIEITQNVVT